MKLINTPATKTPINTLILLFPLDLKNNIERKQKHIKMAVLVWRSRIAIAIIKEMHKNRFFFSSWKKDIDNTNSPNKKSEVTVAIPMVEKALSYTLFEMPYALENK